MRLSLTVIVLYCGVAPWAQAAESVFSKEEINASLATVARAVESGHMDEAELVRAVGILELTTNYVSRGVRGGFGIYVIRGDRLADDFAEWSALVPLYTMNLRGVSGPSAAPRIGTDDLAITYGPAGHDEIGRDLVAWLCGAATCAGGRELEEMIRRALSYGAHRNSDRSPAKPAP